MLDFLSVDIGSILFTLLNTLILFLVMKHFLFAPVNRILEARQAAVDSDLTEAAKARASAEALKADYDAKLLGAQEESAELIKTATRRAQSRSDEIVAQARAEALAVRQHAEDEIERDKRRARAELRDEIAELALMAAEKVVEKEIKPEDHDRLLQEFISSEASEA